MEKNFDEKRDQEIVYSRSVKAGKRIYYLDVRKARNNDLYLCITESKRRQNEGLEDVIAYVKSQLGDIEQRPEWTPEAKEEAAPEEGEKKKGLFGLFK